MARNKKRSREQFEADLSQDNEVAGHVGVGATLAHLRAPELTATNGSSAAQSFSNGTNSERTSGDGEWTKVSKSSRHRQNKRRRKDSVAEVSIEPKDIPNDPTKYPSLTYSEIHKMNTMIRLAEIQNLVLYCLADSTAPQWVAVKHRAAIKKAVVLLVPGLEKGMFDGAIALPENITSEEPSEEVEGVHDPQPPFDKGEPELNDREAAPFQARPQTDVAVQTPVHVGPIGWANADPDDYLPHVLNNSKLSTSLQPLADIFVHLWPVKTPGDDKYSKVHSPLHAMLTSPISKTKEEKEAIKSCKGAKLSNATKNWESTPTAITTFLASIDDLQDNEYTLHPAAFHAPEERKSLMQRREAAKQTSENGWVDTAIEDYKDGETRKTSIKKGDLTAGRTVFAMDCEMCTVEGGEAALTRISAVSWDGQVVMDELVKPEKPITDYLTPYSGMTAAKLDPITTTLSDIQSRLLTLLTPDTIIIGHSLNSDLTALKLTHPFIIDTSLLYPHPRGPPLKSSLKWLAQKYLSREIQKGHGATGHDSVEDARACLDLVRMKCEKGPRWGSIDADREPIFKPLARVPRTGAVTVADGANPGKQGAIVDRGAPEKNFGHMAAFSIGCASDAEVVEGINRAVNGDADGKYIPGGGVELTWARFRELEVLRGWWNDNRNPSTSSTPAADPSPEALAAGVEQTVQHIKAVHESLPPCTLLVVYSGTGDPRELARMQEMQRTFKKEYATKKWDELSVKWTDTEEQELKKACRKARKGIGFVCIK